VQYKNQGFGKTEDDFLIKTSSYSTGKSFSGNSYYRFKVPEPGKTEHTGGLTPGLIGLSEGMTNVIYAEIDWEDRVPESNEFNNSFHKEIILK
jgi:hypothetical protein